MLIMEARGLILEARELILEARGAIFEISGIIVISGGAPARKRIPILNQHFTTFQLFAVLFFDVFSSAHFFNCLRFWVPENSILAPMLILF